jgi:hypothetical protein
VISFVDVGPSTNDIGTEEQNLISSSLAYLALLVVIVV